MEHRGALHAVRGNDEVVVLGLQRQESETVLLGDGADGNAPIGSALGHGDRHGIVRFRLVGVSGGLASLQQAVDQNTRAASGIAIDEKASGSYASAFGCLLCRATFEACIPATKYDPLQSPISGCQFKAGAQKRTIVFFCRGVHQVDSRDVAFAPLGGRKPAVAAHIQRSHREARRDDAIDQQVESDTMAADEDEVRQRMMRANHRHVHFFAGGNRLRLRAHREEAVCLCKRGDRSGAFARRIGDQLSVQPANQGGHDVFRAPTIGTDARGNCGPDSFRALRWESRKGANHRRNEFMEGEDGRGGKTGQQSHRFAAGHRQAERLAGLERYAVNHNPWIGELADGAISQVARALRGSSRKQNHVALQSSFEQSGNLFFIVACNAQLQGHAARLFDRRGEDGAVGVVDNAQAVPIPGCD